MEEHIEQCPVCLSSTLRVIVCEKDIPFFSSIIIISKLCKKCGYKKNDILIKNINEPVRYVFQVENQDDLNARVIRSSTGIIKIPEIGFEMTPGPISDSFITNVEGILERVLKILDKIEAINNNISPSKKKRIEEIREYIALVKEGKRKITIIIEDNFGNSGIISDKPDKVKKEIIK